MSLTKIKSVMIDSDSVSYPKLNAIINGNFDIAQRGTSIAVGSGSSSAYGLDRWKNFKTNTATLTMDQIEDAPTFAESGFMSKYCLEINPSVADAVLSDTAYYILSQPIEGYFLAPFIGKTVTFSFWLKSTKTGATCVKIINYGAGLEILKEFTISQSNTWEKHSWTFELDASQTWRLDNDATLGINFSLGAGSNFQGAATEVWSDFTHHCTSNQVNHFDNAANTFRLSQVQLEIGSLSTPFESRDISTELALCQRYYEKSYNMEDAPGDAANDGSSYGKGIPGNTSRLTIWNSTFSVKKRSAPTITIYSSDGTAGEINLYNNGGTKLTISSVLGYSKRCVGYYFSMTDSLTEDSIYQFQWTADAEI